MTVQDIYIYSEPVRNAHFYYVHAMYYIQMIGYYVQPEYIGMVVKSMMLLNIGKTAKSYMSVRRSEPVEVSSAVVFQGF